MPVPRSRQALPAARVAAEATKKRSRRSTSGDHGATAGRAEVGPPQLLAGSGGAGGGWRRRGPKGRLPPGRRRASSRRAPLLCFAAAAAAAAGIWGRLLSSLSQMDEERVACSHLDHCGSNVGRPIVNKCPGST